MTETPLRDGSVVPPQPRAEGKEAPESEIAHVRHALGSRMIVEQAKGAVSARLGTTPDVAFELLRGLARSQRRDLHEYAEEVVARRGRLDA
jgi:AmiR/NasT family two-component response regulator